MKTDSLFYRLFQTLPSSLFELINISLSNSQQYQFKSVEIKQTSFRLDGIFAPPEQDTNSPIFFIEVQFQAETDFYSRFFSEIFLYLRQYHPQNPWCGVIIYPRRRIDVAETHHYQELLESQRVIRLYLEDLAVTNPSSLSLRLVQLIISSKKQAVNQAQNLVIQAKVELTDRELQRTILDLIETIIVYKMPHLSREEIQQMLGFTEIDLKQTRFYQDVYAEGRQEGRQEGELALVLRLLNRRFKQLNATLVSQVQSLNLEQLEALAEALFEFESLSDLENWLSRH